MPDPEAAREQHLKDVDRLAHCAFALQRLRYEADVLLKSIDQTVLRKAQHAKLDPLAERLRAALAAEPVPTPITDEMVERAAEACDNERFGIDWQPRWDGMPDSYRDMRRQQIRAALDAALNGG